MKTPPVQYDDNIAKQMVQKFVDSKQTSVKKSAKKAVKKSSKKK